MENIDTKGQKNTTDKFYFLCKPIPKKKEIPESTYHTHILNDGENWYCTDGKRMHVIKNDGFKSGVYEVIKNNKSQVILVETDKNASCFPDMKAVIPNIDNAKKIVCNENHISHSYARIIRAMNPERCFQFKYLEDVLVDNDFTCYIAGDNEPLTFKSENKFAMIMPMRF